MASVTQTISNFLGGVSNQPDDKKLPGQVKEAINAYPDPTFGLTKRPGFKYITELKDGVPSGGTSFDNNDLDNAKWFYINRDDDEKYVGCVVGNATEANAAIHVWNTVADGGVFKKSTITYGTNTRQYLNALNSYDYDILNVRDQTIITNKTKPVTVVAGTAYNLNRHATFVVTLVEYSAKYQIDIKIGSTTYTSTYDTKAGDTATNDNDTTNFLDADDILDGLRTKILQGGDSNPGAISGLTCTKIGNTLEVFHTADFTAQAKGGRTGGNSLRVYQNEVQSITELSDKTVHGRIIKIVNTFSVAASYYTKFKAENETSGEGIWVETFEPGGEKGLNSATMPHRLRNTGPNAFTFEVIEDDSTNYAGVFGTARLVGDNETNEHPSCIVRDKESGSITSKTIQQVFYYNNRVGFLTEDNVSMSQSGDYFNFYAESAQTSTAADPIDLSCSSIKEATLHGIIPTAAGLILFSQNQQFIMYSADGNLSPQTALIRGLSNYQMDEKIDPVDVGTNINFISKTHTTAGFTRVFGMLPQGVGQIPKVVDIGRVVSEYIPATITALTASPQNSFIAMYGISDDKVYFYRTYSDGEEDLIQCWFNWQLPGNTHFVEVDSDTMFSVVKTGTGGSARYYLLSATLTQTPEETIIVTSTGQQVNPHMDFYTAASSVKSREVKTLTIAAGGSGYSSAPTLTIAAPPDGGVQATATCTVNSGAINSVTITNCGSGYPIAPVVTVGSGGSGGSVTATVDAYDGSRCYTPYTDITTLDPVIIIAGTQTFSGVTESGFTINPDRASDGDGTYFKVPSKDLYSQASNVYVGYKYSYDITLPKMYFRRDPDGKITDYTAALTVARMKFSIGQSSIVGFKLKRKGVQAVTQTFTGDGSNKVFEPDFNVLDKADVIVKKNGAKQLLTTDYTIADHADQPDNITITFGTAPASGDTVEIYVDQWYTLQPTQEANYYLGDDVPLDTQSTFVVPIHQRTDNYTLRVFSDSPFPVSLTSMAWEGTYSPRYYRRT